jgi:hypothetical protein
MPRRPVGDTDTALSFEVDQIPPCALQKDARSAARRESPNLVFFLNRRTVMLDQNAKHPAPTVYAAIELSKKSWIVAIMQPTRDQPKCS